MPVHWVLGRQEVFLNSAGDLRLLPAVLDAAERFASPPSDDELARLAATRCMTTLFV
jgi:hypothetical protein